MTLTDEQKKLQKTSEILQGDEEPIFMKAIPIAAQMEVSLGMVCTAGAVLGSFFDAGSTTPINALVVGIAGTAATILATATSLLALDLAYDAARSIVLFPKRRRAIRQIREGVENGICLLSEGYRIGAAKSFTLSFPEPNASPDRDTFYDEKTGLSTTLHKRVLDKIAAKSKTMRGLPRVAA